MADSTDTGAVMGDFDYEAEPQVELPDHNGRWGLTYKGYTPSRSMGGRHDWEIGPTSAPETFNESNLGRNFTIHYDPNRAHVEWDEHEGQRLRPYAVVHGSDKLTDLAGGDKHPGHLFRGMSDEEFQEAKQRGHFQSKGDWNLGGTQEGRTYFTPSLGTAEHYSNGYAPMGFRPTFDKPAHVIGIPDQPENPDYQREQGGHEVGVKGQIPFDSLTHHWTGHAAAIRPGTLDVRDNGWGEPDKPFMGMQPSVDVQWEPGEALKRQARNLIELYAGVEDYQGGHQAPANDGYNVPAHNLEGYDDEDWANSHTAGQSSLESRIAKPSEDSGINHEVDSAWLSNGFDSIKDGIRDGGARAITNGYSGPPQGPEGTGWRLQRLLRDNKNPAGHDIIGGELVSRAVHGEPTTKPLWRGASHDPEHLASLQPGHSITLPLSSFTPRYDAAKRYAQPSEENWASGDRPENGKPVIYRLEPGAKAARLSPHPEHNPDDEHVAFGDFRVTSVTPDKSWRGNGPTEIGLQHKSLEPTGSWSYTGQHTASASYAALPTDGEQLGLFDEPQRRALSWDEIGHRHPEPYGEEADGFGIGDAANFLAHDRADDPQAESSSVDDLGFHQQMVHPRHIDFHPSEPGDSRVQRAMQGYRETPEKMPPLALVQRHGIYHVADGHHRAEAASKLDMPVKAYVAQSPFPSEPFSEGHSGATFGAVPVPSQHTAGLNGELPEGLHMVHQPAPTPWDVSRVHAYLPGQDDPVGRIEWGHDNTIKGINVHPDHQRRGIGKALLEHARQISPGLLHSNVLTDQGRAWAQSDPDFEHTQSKFGSVIEAVNDDIEDILNLIGPGVKPAESAPDQPETDWNAKEQNAYRQTPDDSSTAHLWLPTHVLDHYREHDREPSEALQDSIFREGVKQPVRISTDGTHALLHEGNHRLAAAKSQGIRHLPVQVTLDPEVHSNGGRPPQKMEPMLGNWVTDNAHRLNSMWD